MILFVLILLVLAEYVLLLGLGAFVFATSKFKFPMIAYGALAIVINSASLAVQFWWLFGVWYKTFVLGSIAIAAGSLLIGLVTQIVTGNFGADKNIRTNILGMLFGQQANQSRLYQLLSVICLGLIATIIYKTYEMSGNTATEPTIKSATILY